MMDHMMGWGSALALWLLVLLAIVAGVVWLVRTLVDRPAQTGSTKSAIRILEERFARGEIDRDEFEERRRTLCP
ncbi:MAG TPA: SHOCT domain-containing protein [Acidimicrobiia bacterium]|nr:SHOCT domain-containing protein [Acidimicrobiia bacterium]